MKKIVYILCISISLCFAVYSKPIFSESRNQRNSVLNKWYFGSQVSWYGADNLNWNNSVIGTKSNPFNYIIDGGNSYYGYFGYTWKNRIRGQIGAGKWTSSGFKESSLDIDISNSFNYLVDGINGNAQPYDGINPSGIYCDYQVMPIEINIDYIIPIHLKRISPYVGIGYSRNDTKLNYIWKNTADKIILGLKMDETVGTFNINTGFDYFINKDFTIRFSVKYIMGNKKASISSSDIIYDSTILNSSLSTENLNKISEKFNSLNNTIDLDGFNIGIGFSFFFQ